MDRLRLYKWSTFGLLLLNVALVAFLVFGRPRRHPDRVGRAAQSLHLDAEQEAAFRVLAKAHHADVQALRERQAEALRSYFGGLTAGTPSSPAAVPPAVLALEEEKLARTYEHLLDVRGLLHPRQEAYFEDFHRRVLGHVLETGKRRPKSPKH